MRVKIDEILSTILTNTICFSSVESSNLLLNLTRSSKHPISIFNRIQSQDNEHWKHLPILHLTERKRYLITAYSIFK